MKKLIIFLLMTTLPVMAAERIAGPIPAVVVRIVDGDTVKVTAAIWLGNRKLATVRIDGVDTPEMRGKCPAEKAGALIAKDRLVELLAAGHVTLVNIRNGKYAGRVVASVLVDGMDVAPILIAEGLGREYHGGKRRGWCE